MQLCKQDLVLFVALDMIERLMIPWQVSDRRVLEPPH
jgi:hypothetical protein